jgi:hypothetical protein
LPCERWVRKCLFGLTTSAIFSKYSKSFKFKIKILSRN